MKFHLIWCVLLCFAASKYQWVEYWAENATQVWASPSAGSILYLNLITKSFLKKAFVNTVAWSGSKNHNMTFNSTAYT